MKESRIHPNWLVGSLAGTVTLVVLASACVLGPVCWKQWRIRWLVDRVKGSDDFARYTAEHDLIALGSDAVPQVIGLLDEQDPGHRHSGLYLLGRIGSPARSAAKTIRSRMAKEDALYRAYAAETLWRIEGDLDSSLRVLGDILSGDDWSARAEAARVVGAMGAAANRLVPVLQEALYDNDAEVAVAAYDALCKIDTDFLAKTGSEKGVRREKDDKSEEKRPPCGNWLKRSMRGDSTGRR